MFDVEDYFEDEIKFIYNNKEYLLEEGDIVNKKINSLNIEFPEGVKVQEITEDKEIENIKQNDNIQEQKNVDEIDEVEEEIEEQVSKDIEQLAISLLEQQGCFEALIEKIRNGTYKIYSNKEGGVTPNKCKIITIDANGNKTPIYYFKFFSLEKPEEIDDFGKTSIEQLSLTYVTQILDSTNLNVSTCKMTAIENTEDKLHNMIITKAAENPINIESAYTHAHNFERDSPAFFEVSKAINGRKNNLLSTKECFSSENTLQAILAKHENDLDWQKNFLESMYSVLATASVFDLYDVRVDGNIMIDEKSGKWQLIDFDIEKDLTIDGNKNGLEFTPAKNRECLENRKEAQDICELCINSFSGYYFDADGFFLSIDQIITGKQVVNNEEIVYKIPEELSEFKDYKQKIAENILQISNTIDERHNELQNKQINGDELTKKEKQELIFLKERHANIMKIFEKTEIGKYTAMIYEQEKGQKIQAYTETETELSTVAIDVSKRNKRDIENDNIVCNDSKIEITQQAKRIGEQIINLNNQKQGELYAVRI